MNYTTRVTRDPKRRQRARLVPRKTPEQARSRQMMDDLLAGAARVLEERGAEGLTTNHVAEATGVSIGSLYQYYPNKAALLAALHDREAHSLGEKLELLLGSGERPPRDRFRDALHTCFWAQFRARELHQALEGASVRVSDSPDFSELAVRLRTLITLFLEQSVPARTADASEHAEHVCFVVLGLLERLGHEPLSEGELARRAESTSTMLADFVGL